MPPGKTFKGLSYGDWVAIWSNWLISRDVDSYDGEDMLFLKRVCRLQSVSEAQGAMRYQDPDSVLDRTGIKNLDMLKGYFSICPSSSIDKVNWRYSRRVSD